MLPVSLSGVRTLTYVIAGALVLGAGSIEFYRRHASTRERARFGLLRDDAELFADAFATSLRIPEACAQIFGHPKVEPGQRRPVELEYQFEPTAATPLAAGIDAWAGTKLGHLDLTVPKEPDQRTRVGGRALRRFRARLDAAFVIPERFATGVEHAFEVFLWLDDENAVQTCFGPSSVGALCNLTGGYYDAEADDPNTRCRASLHAVIESRDGPLPRGSCRVTALARNKRECPGGPKASFVTQAKAGFGTNDVVVCRTCD